MLTRTALFVFALALPGCLWIPKADTGEPSEAIDADGDGYSTLEDCDDGDAAVHPGADETCNGVDDDCDDEVDEDDAVDATTWYADEDGDGYGAPETTRTSCAQPSGFVDDDTDCDDSDATINPETLWYPDSDGDGFGDEEDDGTEQCEQPTDHVLDATDCDDSAEDVNPDEEEQCDEVDHDCDGENGLTDADSDGWAVCENDCDDSDAAVNPGATEVCDEIDNDCDGDIDEADAQDAATWYLDADSDGYGTAEVTVTACNQPTGYVDDSTDCDDEDSAVNPAATEVCDEIDNDCDGDTDDDDASLDTTTASTWYTDGDGDGYGDSASTSLACDQPSGTVSDSTDCDDGDSAVNPAATEVCDEIDNDCDGDTDDDDTSLDTTTASTWYTDGDGDGYGDSASTSLACDQPSGSVSDDTDCDDGDASAYPGADEYCDGTDNDCDGDTDEDEAVDATTWYADTDSDGYGDVTSSYVACYAPSNHVSDATDCDDSDSAINPAASEICNGIDDDCDGDVDDDDGSLDTSTASSWYADTDSDGYGDSTSSSLSCDAPSGSISDATDCDDTDSAINPAATEICDRIDNDCDGDVDDDDGSLDTSTASTWYADADSDGYGDSSSSSLACEALSSTVSDPTDCDDSDGAINPAATEICDEIDNDCDGDIDDEDSSLDSFSATTWYADGDADGYGDSASTSLACDQPSGTVADDTDCDDTDSAINPVAVEVCDEIDNDCDGDVDDDDSGLDVSTATIWYLDGDGDGYGEAATFDVTCVQLSGYVADDTDCDDSNARVFPGALDLEDGLDNDCDGSTDEFTLADADSLLVGDEYGEATVYVTPAGDVDGDGVSDILIGSYDTRGWLVNGPVTGDVDLSVDACQITGLSRTLIVGAGDLDDDGYDDILLANNQDSGATGVIHLVFGHASLGASSLDLSSDSDLSIVGDAALSYLPADIDASADLTGDGINDLLVGHTASGTGFDGIVTLIAGPISASTGQVSISSMSDTQIDGASSGDYLGSSLAAGGDLDGDGYNDAVFGADRTDSTFTDGGAVYIALGPITASSLDITTDLHMIDGAMASERTGSEVAVVGDTNLDGYDDLLVGAFYASSGAGRAYLVHGPGTGITSMTSADATIEGDLAGDYAAGTSALGDLDGDGAADFAVRAISADCEGSTRGAYYLFFDSVTGTLSASSADATICGDSDNAQLGYGKQRDSNYGDLDLDGTSDVGIVSRSGYLWLLQPEQW